MSAPKIVVLLGAIRPGTRPFGRQTLWLIEAALRFGEGLIVTTPLALERDVNGWRGEKRRVSGWIWREGVWCPGEGEFGGVLERCFGVAAEERLAFDRVAEKMEEEGEIWSNPRSFVSLCQDKWACFCALSDVKVPTPWSFLLSREEGFVGEGEWICKPRFGSHGEGVWVVDRGGERFVGVGGECLEREEWWGRCGGGGDWLVQPRVCGEEGRARELRLWLQRGVGGGWQVSAGALRSGREGELASNLAQGGRYFSWVGAGWVGLEGEVLGVGARGEEAEGLHKLCASLLCGLERVWGEQGESVCEMAVDLIEGVEGWMVLECNSKPGRSVHLMEGGEGARRRLVETPFAYLGGLIEEQRGCKRVNIA